MSTGHVPKHTRLEVSDVDPNLNCSMEKWLRSHGKVVKPKLSSVEKGELLAVFSLMDEDGSGAIGVEELEKAFDMLGFNLKRSEIEEIVLEVDHDGSGEVEYDEFLEIMTVSLLKMAEAKSKQAEGKEEAVQMGLNQVPFALITTAYKRKKLMENVVQGSASTWGAVVEANEAEVLAREEGAKMMEENALRKSLAAQNTICPLLKKVSEVCHVPPHFLDNTFQGDDELKIVLQMGALLNHQGMKRGHADPKTNEEQKDCAAGMSHPHHLQQQYAHSHARVHQQHAHSHKRKSQRCTSNSLGPLTMLPTVVRLVNSDGAQLQSNTVKCLGDYNTSERKGPEHLPLISQVMVRPALGVQRPHPRYSYTTDHPTGLRKCSEAQNHFSDLDDLVTSTSGRPTAAHLVAHSKTCLGRNGLTKPQHRASLEGLPKEKDGGSVRVSKSCSNSPIPGKFSVRIDDHGMVSGLRSQSSAPVSPSSIFVPVYGRNLPDKVLNTLPLNPAAHSRLRS